jgi:hypothetical protein
MMKTFNINSRVILVLCIMSLGVWCYGEDDYNDAVPMEEGEKTALYSAIQGFVGNWWNGSDLYPDPCGWTPVQVHIHLLSPWIFFFFWMTPWIFTVTLRNILSQGSPPDFLFPLQYVIIRSLLKNYIEMRLKYCHFRRIYYSFLIFWIRLCHYDASLLK